MKPANPFITRGYRGPEYFCDRREETKKIVSALTNERNVTLMAPRRYGKTGLIKNVFHCLPKDFATIYVDIYDTSNLREFTEKLAGAVLGALDSAADKFASVVGRFFRSVRPKMTTDGSGSVTFSFSIDRDDAETTLSAIFDYLASKEKRIVIAIDEFQQILDYPEKGTEALLRSRIQFLDNTGFIFAGSRHHLMAEMFVSPRHPFYQSTDIMSLLPIDKKAYLKFAKGFFTSEDRAFSDMAFESIYNRFDGVTWYVQAVLNRIWSEGGGLESEKDVSLAIEALVDERALTFHDLMESQTATGKALLAAIAREKVVKEITASSFLRNNSLSAPSSVRTALEGLIKADLVYRSEDGYLVYDRLLGEYLRSRLVH
ncbi:MAG: AAA family ATPase [Victivallales bacterium]|nr:AAA family ATPase [Victivallales bacterium]